MFVLALLPCCLLSPCLVSPGAQLHDEEEAAAVGRQAAQADDVVVDACRQAGQTASEMSRW